MPIYEYVCSECGERFEKFVRSMSAQSEASCPKCGSANTRKVISRFGISASGAGSGTASADTSCAPTGG